MPFSIGGFLKDIQNVDQDLRLMALFDLQSHLRNEGEVQIAQEVVDKVLSCLSGSERCEQVQNDAANVLPEMVVKCDRREIVLRFLLTHVTRKPTAAERDDSNLHYLCGMAFKKCCTDFAEEARRNLTFWQKQMEVARNLCVACEEQLSVPDLDVSAREILYTALNAIVVAYKDALYTCDALVQRAVQDFRTVPSLRHATLMLIESLLPRVRIFMQENIVSESLSWLLHAESQAHYVVYLQLCNAELRALPTPSPHAIQQVLSSACERLDQSTKRDDEVEDCTGVLLEVVSSLLPLSAHNAAVPWKLLSSAVKHFLTFDPSKADTAVPYVDDAFDDEYGDYYNYDAGSTDTTWRLRMWSAHVLQLLVAQQEDKELGFDALVKASEALCDRVLEVQLEAVKLIRTVIRRSYVQDATKVDLMIRCCQQLCTLVGGGDEGLTVCAMKALEDIFKTFSSFSALLEVTIPLLQSRVREYSSTLASSAAAVEGCIGIVTSLIMTQRNALLRSNIVSLANELPQMCLHGSSRAALAPCITKTGEALVQTYTATQDASVPEALGSHYSVLLDSSSFPIVCRAAAAGSLASWIAAHGLASMERHTAALWRALEAESMQLDVLHALTVMSSSERCSVSLPKPVIEKVVGLLESRLGDVRVAAVEFLLSLFAASHASSLEASFTPRLTALFSAGRPLSLATCQLDEVRSFTCLLAHLFQRSVNVNRSFYRDFVAAAWRHVAELASAVLWTRNRIDSTLGSLTSLVATVHMAETTSRLSIEEDVRFFLQTNCSHMTSACVVVRCVCTSSAAASAFLTTLVPLIEEPAHLLLCVGEAGRVVGLDSNWATQALDSVQSKKGELVRSCGERALSYCMLNPSNVEAILRPCGMRATDSHTVGRYYYVAAMKEAATLALDSPNTSFHDSDVSRFLLDLFLDTSAGTDLMELYGACAGHLSLFLRDAPTSLRIADALFKEGTSLDTRVTCMVALRHFLGAVIERSMNAEAYRPVIVGALLRLHDFRDAKYDKTSSLPLRSMTLRLLTAVVQHCPQWLMCEEMRITIFPDLLVELLEDAALQGTFQLSGYTHTVDKGLECRKLAFESLGALFRKGNESHVDLVDYCGGRQEVMDKLLVACSPHQKGDQDKSINDTAKHLLTCFMRTYPDYAFSSAQLDSLVAKLDHDISGVCPSTEAQKTTLLYTIKCIMELSCYPHIAYYPGFQKVADAARASPLLAQSMRV